MILLLTFLSAMFYRAGGAAGWNTKYRDLGVAVFATTVFYFLGFKAAWWVYLIAGVIHFAALTSYWSWVNKLLRRMECPKCSIVPDSPTCKETHCYNTYKNKQWWNWLLTGFGYSLGALPFYFFGNVSWLWFSVRLVALPLSVMMWSQLISHDELEECGRGATILVTLSILNL